MANVHTAQGDAPFFRIVKPGDQRSQRALAGAGGTDDAHHFAGFSSEADVLEHPVAVRMITEINVVEDQIIASQWLRFFWFADSRLYSENIIDAVD